MTRSIISDRYEYTNEESISEHLKCIICTNPLIDPVKTKCKPKQHIFCQTCIKQWLQRSSSCPKCQQTIQIKDLIPITEQVLIDMLNELQVRCSICKRTGLERAHIDEHMTNQCRQRNISCSSADIQCSWTGSNQQLEQHLKTCPYTILRSTISQFINEKKQVEKKLNQQQILIDQLQQENQELKQQSKQQKRPTSILPNTSRRLNQQKYSEERKSSAKQNQQPSSAKVSCNDCTDCWCGAVRGSYFRGVAGGGFQPGTTLLPCECLCHQ